MNDCGANLAKSRAIITTACRALQNTRRPVPGSARRLDTSSAACDILLHDATMLYGQSVSEQFGETENKRWSPALPELLLSHPDKCSETLALPERKEFKELSYFH